MARFARIALLVLFATLALLATRALIGESRDRKTGESRALQPRADGIFGISITPSNPTVGESDGAILFTASLTGCNNAQNNVTLTPQLVFSGTASADDAAVGTPSFVLGQTASATQFSLFVVNDELDEDELETFSFTIQDPSGGVFELECDEGSLTFACQQAPCGTTLRTVTIVDNDSATPTPTPTLTPTPVACVGEATLSCDSAVDAGNNAEGGTDSEFSSYPCLVSSYPGADRSYDFVAPEEGRYTVNLAGANGLLQEDLDLVVVRGQDESCAPSNCVGASDASGLASESVTFDALANEEFLIVVDAREQAATSDFRIELVCPASPEANFQVVPEFPTAGQQIAFFDRSSGPPTEHAWSFGDGFVSSAKNPTHSFANPGTFPVTLTVKNGSGSDNLTRQIVVAPANGEITVVGPGAGVVGSSILFQANALNCNPVANGWSWLTAGGVIQGPANASTVAVQFASEGSKTVSATNVACGSAQGSATLLLDRPNVTQPPAAPTNVTAEVVSSTEVVVKWVDQSTTEDGFRVDRFDGAEWQKLGTAPANATSLLVSLEEVEFPTTSLTLLRVNAFNAFGDSAAQGSLLDARALAANEVEVTTASEPCDSSKSLCLLGKRFRVEARWNARFLNENQGIGHPVALTEDTGYFWFFSQENVELVVKVLDGVPITGKYWVFFGALSQVQYTIRVTDTVTGNVKEYINPAGTFASIGDTGALPPETAAASGAASASDALSSFELVDTSRSLLAPRAIDVDFDVAPETGRATTDLLFEDRSQPPGDFRARSWRFGNDDPLASQEATVRYSFAEPGTYDVTLEVLDLFGDFFGAPDATTKRVDITPPVDPTFKFVGPATTVEVGQQITLSASADESCSPAFRGWKWQVDDANIVGKNNRPTIDLAWPSAGDKTVIVTNSRCESAEIVPQTVIVTAATGTAGSAVMRADGTECQSSETTLCLEKNRFKVEVAWRNVRNNKTGVGTAERVTNQTGYFWFFNEANVELMIKVLDARRPDGSGFFWVFYGALSDVEYTITVTDVETGRVKTYFNPAGTMGSVGDTAAFPGS
jgi:PKD repeat protein